jgi:hypothetical protein
VWPQLPIRGVIHMNRNEPAKPNTKVGKVLPFTRPLLAERLMNRLPGCMSPQVVFNNNVPKFKMLI